MQSHPKEIIDSENGAGCKTEAYHVEGSGISRASDDQGDNMANVVEGNLTYDNAEQEPEIHFRTWIAVAAMMLLNFVQIIALQGPPVVVSLTFSQASNLSNS